MEDFFSMLTDEAPKKGARSVCGMCLCMCFCVSPPRKKRTTSNNTCSRCFASAVLVRTCGRFALTYVCIFSYLKCIVDSISICPVGFLSFSRKLCWFRTSPAGGQVESDFVFGQESRRQTAREHAFWDTQPVPSIGSEYGA